MVCAECMKMCRLGGKNSVVKGLRVCPMSGAHANLRYPYYGFNLEFIDLVTDLVGIIGYIFVIPKDYH